MSRVEALRRRTLADRESSLERPLLVPYEINLERIGWWTTGKKSKETRVWESSYTDELGNEIQQRLEVSPGTLGIIRSFDFRVYRAVGELVVLLGGMPKNGIVHFNINELREIMRLTEGGKATRMIKESLLRIALTNFISSNAFYSGKKKRNFTGTFKLWDVRFDDVEGDMGFGGRHRLEFSKIYLQSFRENYLRNLDTTKFWELERPVAQRLYGLIDLKRAGESHWRVDVWTLQHEIPVGPYKYPAKIRDVLKPAHDELVNAGVLASVDFEGTGKNTVVVYTVAPSFVENLDYRADAGSAEEAFVFSRLLGEGIASKLAREWLRDYGATRCSFYLDCIPVQTPPVQNAGGFLARYLPNNWRPKVLPQGHPYNRTFGKVAELDGSSKNQPTLSDAEDEVVDVQIGDEGGAPEMDVEILVPDPTANDLWLEAVKDLSGTVNTASLSVWFAESFGVRIEGDTLTAAVPGDLVREDVSARFSERIEGFLAQRLGENARLELVIAKAGD